MSRREEYVVQAESALLQYLLQLHKGQSKTSVKAMLKHGQVCINGVTEKRGDRQLKTGDKLVLNHEKTQTEFKHPQLRIVWQDDELIVVDKKEGLLSVSDSPAQERTAYFLLNDYVRKINSRNRIFILHRLDKGTSGLLMFARNREIQEYMRASWHNIITRRTYIAIIEGVPAKTEDTVISYLAENSRMKVYCTDRQHGKQAILHYKVLSSNALYALVEIELETGRKNQIRAQMEYIGHPVVGDPKYGAATNPAGRLMLHAMRLCFIHPATGEELRFESKPPKEFEDFFKLKL